MNKKELQIIALNTSQSSPGNYALILEEVVEKKKMVIIIGAFEAQAIAIYMERMQLPRPLTHDIFKIVIDELGGTLQEVIIESIVDNTFQASLIIKTKDKEEKKIDCRASDALALAVRFNCAIFVNNSVLLQSEIEETFTLPSTIKGSLADYTFEQLQNLLQDVLKKEDYESATRIRDIIARRFSL